MKNIKEIEQRMKSLSSARRLGILLYIHKYKTATVNEIADSLKISKYLVSQQLRILRLSNLVISTRRGIYISYRLPIKRDPILKAVLAEIE